MLAVGVRTKERRLGVSHYGALPSHPSPLATLARLGPLQATWRRIRAETQDLNVAGVFPSSRHPTKHVHFFTFPAANAACGIDRTKDRCLKIVVPQVGGCSRPGRSKDAWQMVRSIAGTPKTTEAPITLAIFTLVQA